MPTPRSEDLRIRAIAAVMEDGLSRREAARRFKVGDASVVRKPQIRVARHPGNGQVAVQHPVVRPLTCIEPIEILDALRKVEKRDAPEMARRIMQMASALFRYGVATSRCVHDPTTDLRGALVVRTAVKSLAALDAEQPVLCRDYTPNRAACPQMPDS